MSLMVAETVDAAAGSPNNVFDLDGGFEINYRNKYLSSPVALNHDHGAPFAF